MLGFASTLYPALVLFLFGLPSVNFWLMLAGIAIFCLQTLYYGWWIINS